MRRVTASLLAEEKEEEEKEEGEEVDNDERGRFDDRLRDRTELSTRVRCFPVLSLNPVRLSLFSRSFSRRRVSPCRSKLLQIKESRREKRKRKRR